MAFQTSGIPKFDFGTFEAPARPRAPRRRVSVKGPSRTAGMAGLDRNYEQQIDDREHRQSLEMVEAQKQKIKPEAAAGRQAMAVPDQQVVAMPEKQETLAQAIERGAVYQPGEDRNQSLVAFLGELMRHEADDLGRRVLSREMLSMLPGFVGGYSVFREQQRPAFAQLEEDKSGEGVFAFYERTKDGVATPLLHNGRPWRLKKYLVEDAANLSRLGQKRVNELEDRDFKAKTELAKAKLTKVDKTRLKK